MAFANPDARGDRPLLDIPEFALEHARHVALIGESGSGKTTLLHLLAGLLLPRSGQIFYATSERPVDIAALSEPQRDQFRARWLGYVFQTHHLLPGFTALENVLLGMSFSGRKADRPWALHLLEQVGLADRLHYPPRKLSTGQQQRVAVARALANRPALVLADEPTGSLDAANAAQVIQLITGLCRQAHAALLLVTHDRGLAGALDQVVDLAVLNRAVSSPASRSPSPS
jgi:putative ABC transport system ATP-binding protein